MRQSARPQVWTGRRKVLGNVIPMLFWAPPFAYGALISIQNLGPTTGAIAAMVASPVLGIVSLNWFGFFENRRMQEILRRILAARGHAPADDAWFVGYASAQFRGLVDAHEDVGFLALEGDDFVFRSEQRTVAISRAEIERVGRAANLHTALGLGGWIEVRTKAAEIHRFEPRRAMTMAANRRLRPELEAFFR